LKPSANKQGCFKAAWGETLELSRRKISYLNQNIMEYLNNIVNPSLKQLASYKIKILAKRFSTQRKNLERPINLPLTTLLNSLQPAEDVV
jgi:hypothetical protein